MSQFLRPDGQITSTDISAGTWQSIDEVTFSDADFIIGSNDVTATYEASLSNPGATPASGTCTVRFRQAQGDFDTSPFAPATGGTAGATVECAVFQGTTQIATSGAVTASTSGAFVANSFTFNTSSITDWTDLRLRFTITRTGGNPGNRRTGAVSWAEIEIPDPPGAALAAVRGAISTATVALTAPGPQILLEGFASGPLVTQRSSTQSGYHFLPAKGRKDLVLVWPAQGGGSTHYHVSTDGGDNWTQYALPTTGSYEGIGYLPDSGTFILMNSTIATTYTSTDCVNWTNRGSQTSYLSHGDTNGLSFFYGTAAFTLRYTSDGVTWGTTASWGTNQVIPGKNGIAYGNGRYVLATWNSYIRYLDSLGGSWTSVTTPYSVGVNVTFGDGWHVIGCSTQTDRLQRSNDGGVTWEEVIMPATGLVWREATYLAASNTFIAMTGGNIGTRKLATSTDAGATWELLPDSLGTSSDWRELSAVEDICVILKAGTTDSMARIYIRVGSAVCTASGTLSDAEVPGHPLNGVISSLSAIMSAGLTTGVQLNASVLAQCSIVQAQVTGVSAALSGTIASLSAALSVELTTALRLNAVVTAETTITGAALATEIKAHTSTAAQSTSTASLTSTIRLNTSVQSLVTVTSALTTSILTVATISSVSAITGALTTTIRLNSTLIIESAVLNSTLSLPARFNADVTSLVTTTAALTTAIQLAGSAFAVNFTEPRLGPEYARAEIDITTTGWTRTPASGLFSTKIGEPTPSDDDYVTSPPLDSPTPLKMVLTDPMFAGANEIQVRADGDTGGSFRIVCFDIGYIQVGATEWRVVTSTFTTYLLDLYLTGDAVSFQVEVTP